jgi:peptide/nickel transport system permease protein
VLRFVLWRVGGAVATLAAGAVVAFAVFHLLPGDPAAVIGGPGASTEQIDAIRERLGLDDSLPVQFVDWLGRIVRGDLGRSFFSNVPVRELFEQRVPVTLELIVTSTVVALAVSVFLALGALRPGSLLDRMAVAWSIVWLAVPIFWLGVLLALVFGVRAGLVPTSGFVSFLDDPGEAIRFALLPSVTLGFYMSAILTQFLRRSLLDVMQEDYVRTARAKGLRERQVIVGHAAKPALIPFVTVLGILVGTAVGGTILVEAVFNYPGFGRLFVDSILKRDYFVVQGGILLVVVAVIVANLVVDLVYALLDPRIRLSGVD